ncbi:MAG: NAD(P)H-quinone oxidoreductase [Acidobacteria bacterium]|nr:NAD(P)H-quinone oxidoreductase [Acidobacteriota bacterium]MCA1637983.1 NAD(P)H-quinone oxidoreductase [Acidobacteriota bacterium]
MKAVFVKEFGGAEHLEIREVEDLSKPNESQILVRVKAAGLNRADVLQRKGVYPAPKGFPERILGLEFSGEVAEIGENVSNFKIGDRVFGITAGGAQADFVLTKEALMARIPENLNFVEAAAIPEAFITAHDAVFTQGNLQEGETLLIHAVGSGVGLAALQLAKAKNIKTFGTSRTKDKLLKCNGFGLDTGILVGKNSVESNPKYFAELIQFGTNEKGVDVILDLVGANYFAANLESLALKGRLVLVGLTSGAKAEFDLGTALSKRLKIIGTVLRSRSTEEKAQATRAFIKEVLPLIEKRLIKPNIDKIFRFEDVKKAHEYMESNESFGKIVLEF